MNQLLKSIKRNPIILAAITIIALQVIEDWGSFTTKDWFQNLFTMAIAFMAREFTVPAKENEELRSSVAKKITELEDDYKAARNRFEGGRQ